MCCCLSARERTYLEDPPFAGLGDDAGHSSAVNYVNGSVERGPKEEQEAEGHTFGGKQLMEMSGETSDQYCSVDCVNCLVQ